jgi:Glycosyltransferase Family 4
VTGRSNRVVHLSTLHPWEDNRVFGRECRSLARNGYEVVLVAVADRPCEQDAVRVIPVPRASNRLARMLTAVPRTLWLAWRLRAAVYHLHDPELIPIAPLLRVSGARVVYDAHEDLPCQVLDKTYLPAASRSPIAVASRGLCWFAGRVSSHVIAATPTIARRFPGGATTVLHNYP